jgi:hypothetical protein
MLELEEVKAHIEQRLGAYKRLLQAVLDDYDAMSDAHERSRRVGQFVDFDAEWELRVHRNMIEQLRAEMVAQIETLQKYAIELERRASKAGHATKKELPKPESQPSSQQSIKVRLEATRRLLRLRIAKRDEEGPEPGRGRIPA